MWGSSKKPEPEQMGFGMLHSTAGRDPRNPFQPAQPSAPATVPVTASPWASQGSAAASPWNNQSSVAPASPWANQNLGEPGSGGSNPFGSLPQPASASIPGPATMRTLMNNKTSGRSGFESFAPSVPQPASASVPVPASMRTLMNNKTSGRSGFESFLPSNQHVGVYCDGCGSGAGSSSLMGTRYKCSSCPNFDLCSSCMDSFDRGDVLRNEQGSAAAGHPRDHCFLRLPRDVGLQPAPAYANRDVWIHHNISCADCNVAPIVGYRYFCTVCATSFCETCEQQGLVHATAKGHTLQHNLLKMVPPPAQQKLF